MQRNCNDVIAIRSIPENSIADKAFGKDQAHQPN
jgi:hypothetical protein